LKKWSPEEIKDFPGEIEKCFLLRYAVHIMGDLHQPLHTATLFDDKLFPNGDEGGNFFNITYKIGIENLHKLYDSIFDNFDNSISRVRILINYSR
jgi:hypothetical protein